MKFHVRSSKFHSLRGFVFLDITKIWKRRLFSCKISKVILLWFVKFQVFEFCFPLRFCKNIKASVFLFRRYNYIQKFLFVKFFGTFFAWFFILFYYSMNWTMKKSLCCLLWGIKQQQAKGSSTYVEKTLNWWTWSMLVSKSDCMNTNSNVCIVFLRTKFKKKRHAIGGFWSKFTKVLTVERLYFNVWNKKKDCIHANIQQKGNTRNCVSFFLFINHERSEKQKKEIYKKK